uniref:multiple coagulation factor deficiency protein 2 homolog n=1 Tax=Pristiophorus japonicus TaxID=55135 RepID=UPI00398E4FD3
MHSNLIFFKGEEVEEKICLNSPTIGKIYPVHVSACYLNTNRAESAEPMQKIGEMSTHLEEELKHHLGEVDLDEMSIEELEFYYFTLHDFDKNMHLDGLEIMTALEESLEEPLAAFSTEDMMTLLIEMTDEVLEKDDVDKDGLLYSKGAQLPISELNETLSKDNYIK